jgi:hypothetical protein
MQTRLVHRVEHMEVMMRVNEKTEIVVVIVD